jgi:hypothetical protein
MCRQESAQLFSRFIAADYTECRYLDTERPQVLRNIPGATQC